MALIVQKYGGSSVADAGKIRNVACRIGKAHDAGNQVVAVVSAMGDTTDHLIGLAHQVSADPDRREMDTLLATGELVSCTLMAMALRALGHQAISLSGTQAGIRTTSTYGKALIEQVDPQRIQQELEKGKVVVVAGFQGFTADMDVTTLGRGGSDTTAVALAAVLKADRCDIYTDVEGIYTADPRVVPNARRLKEIGYEEMLELASLGAKMHPRSIELGAVYNVPIYVASSFKDTPGTLIHGDAETMETRKRVTGIAYDINVAKITVRSVPDMPGVAASLFEPLSDAGISVDTIVQNSSIEKIADMSFTVTRSDLKRALEIVGASLKKVQGGEVSSDANLAKVSIVGSGMQNTPGYASRMFQSLARVGVNIDMIATSEIRITCIVREDQVRAAVRALHEDFELEREE
jgi:aspartate kinase